LGLRGGEKGARGRKIKVHFSQKKKERCSETSSLWKENVGGEEVLGEFRDRRKIE